MKSLPGLFAAIVLSIFTLGVLTGCSGIKPPTTKTLTSIAVTPASPAHLKVGATQQFTATGTFSDDTTSDLTASATWTSGTPATATISTAGLATGVASGTTSITATSGTVTSTPAVALTVIALQSIEVKPNPATVAVAGTLQFAAKGTYTDASTADITSQVTWASSAQAIATITASGGLATGVAAGGSTITATLGAIVSQGVVLSVGGAVVPVSLKIFPVNPTIIVGGTADFTAVELMSDGSTQPVPGAITWTSGTPANASILASVGIAKGLAAGTSTITASFSTLTGNTLLTVVAAAPRFAYATSPSDPVASGYAINGSTNALVPIPSLVEQGLSFQLVFEPSGQFAYAPGVDGAIRIYSIDPVTGILTQTSFGIPSGGLPSFVASVTSIGQSVIDPTGRYLYVVDFGTNAVNAFSINLDTTSANYGNLTVIASSPSVATGSFPFGIAVTPDGKYLYVTDSDSAASSISGYSIGTDGGLTPITITAAQLSTLNTPVVPAIDPAGKFLFVPNNDPATNTVTAFSINSTTGDLTRIGTTDISTNLNTPFQAVTDPAGTFLFVTNSGDGTVAAFSIGGTGALTATTRANSGTSPGSFTQGIAIDPTGSYAVTVNVGENTATLFTLASGVLTPKFTAGSRIIPEFVSFYAGAAAPVIGPSNVFAANSGSANISGFTANSTTGGLGTATTAAGQSGNAALAADITGNFLYSSSASAKSMGGFAVTQSSAALSALSGTPFHLTTNTDVPADILTEPSSRTLFVADTTGNLIETFSTGNNPTSSGTTAFTSVNDIAVDPQGTFLIALGTGSITSAGISGFTGTLQLGNTTTTLTQAGTWTSGAVDPTGLWVVALDSAGKTLQSIAFTPILNLFDPTSTDGALTAQGALVPTGLASPSSVTFDPLGRFVFVSDATAGKIAVFTFTNGVVAASGTPITVDATGTGRVSVDASGTYLYAAVKGNGSSVPAGVAAYKINSNGTLTALTGSPFAAGAGTSGTAGVAVTSSVQ